MDNVVEVKLARAGWDKVLLALGEQSSNLYRIHKTTGDKAAGQQSEALDTIYESIIEQLQKTSQ